MLRPAKSYNLDALDRDELEHISDIVAFHPEEAVAQLFPDNPDRRKHRIAAGLIGKYARMKSKAIYYRRRGTPEDSQVARDCESECDAIYRALPDFAKGW